MARGDVARRETKMGEWYMKQLSCLGGFAAKLAQMYTYKCPCRRTALPILMYMCSGCINYFLVTVFQQPV